MFKWIASLFGSLFGGNKYASHPEAVIVACYFNPENSPYRLLAFQKWYRSIKHLNHRIIECVIGDGKPQLPDSPYITRVQSDSLLWHKESLLNKAISELPEEFKYVFWLDADVLFTNNNWLPEAVQELERGKMIVQPFEYCVHLERNQLVPDFDVDAYRATVSDPKRRHKRLWRSFAANHRSGLSGDKNYDRHGHVGFAWGARREVLDECPLYDRALIGGADHIIAHAAAGQINHECISKSFTDNLDEVNDWSRHFSDIVRGRIGFVRGDLYHIWHGDIAKRQYLKRIKDFTPQSKEIQERDANGLHVQPGNQYMRNYFRDREVRYYDDFGPLDDPYFYEDMGYLFRDILWQLQQQQIAQEQRYWLEQGYAVNDQGYPVDDQGNVLQDVVQQQLGIQGEAKPYQPSPEEAALNALRVDDVSASAGGPGRGDDGRYIITDEQLQGATISDPPRHTDELERAIHSEVHESQYPAAEASVESENFS